MIYKKKYMNINMNIHEISILGSMEEAKINENSIYATFEGYRNLVIDLSMRTNIIVTLNLELA